MRFLLVLLLLSFPTSFLCADQSREDIAHLINQSDIRGVEPTGSMKPTLDEHCFFLVSPIPFNALKCGDIILFTNPDNLLVVHRIWRISSGGSVVLTKGDNNQAVDPWYVTEKNYVGMVTGIIRADLMQKVLTQDKISAQ